MVRVESKKLTPEDCMLLARITKSARKDTPLESEKSVEVLAKNIEKLSMNDEFQILTAYDEKRNIVGWTYFYLAFPLMAFISGFYPTVIESRDADEIASSLIEASKSHIVNLGQHSRLEIEMVYPTAVHRSHYEKLVKLYQDCDFQFAAEEIHMKSNLSGFKLPEIDALAGYVVRNFSEVTYDVLEGPGFDTLKNSREGLFLSMSHAEQEVTLKYFFDKSKPYIDDASLILEEEGEVIGFVITRLNDDNEPEIGPVGLVPEARGKGLASYLLVRVLRSLKENGFSCVYLDTTTTNYPAQRLYRKFGFEDVYYKQFYYWSP